MVRFEHNNNNNNNRIFLVSLFMLKEAGDFLVINEEPEKSDVVIVLSGGGIERIEKAVEIYNKDFAPYIMLSNGQEDNLYEALLQMGVPNDSIILENNASSTRESAFFTKELMVTATIPIGYCCFL